MWPYVDAMSSLGTHYKDLGKYSEADALYRQALVIEPKYGLVWYNLGVMQRQLHQFTAAEKSYLKALKVGYSDEESLLYNIAELYKSSWQFHKATTYVKTLNIINFILEISVYECLNLFCMMTCGFTVRIC